MNNKNYLEIKTKFYRFLSNNENVGISNTRTPKVLLNQLQKDGVLVDSYEEVDSNEAICEISQRKDRPLPMDYCNLYNQGYDVVEAEYDIV